MVEGELMLPDGRTLGYVEWGTHGGPAVVLCHPATRVAQPGWDCAGDAGVRVVLPDRPGLGRSSFQEGRTALDWPADIAALMTHLAVDRFFVAGVSAATRYALACGLLLADRVIAAGLIAGTTPPMGEPDDVAALARSDPAAALAEIERRAAERSRDDVPAAVRAGQRPEPDGSLYRRPEVQEALTAAAREASRQGPRGPAYESLIGVSPWGFALADLPVPCLWWHGEADSVVPPTRIEQAIAGLPQHSVKLVRGAGHGVCMTHVVPFLRELVTVGSRGG